MEKNSKMLKEVWKKSLNNIINIVYMSNDELIQEQKHAPTFDENINFWKIAAILGWALALYFSW